MGTDIEIVKVVVDLGAFGLVAWLFFQTFSKTLPKNQDSFVAALEKQRQDYLQDSARQRTDFINTLRSEREEFLRVREADKQEFMATLKDQESELIRAVSLLQQEMAANRGAFLRGLRGITRSLDRLTIGFTYHDATCRGQDAEVLGNTEDMLRMMRSMDEGWGEFEDPDSRVDRPHRKH